MPGFWALATSSSRAARFVPASSKACTDSRRLGRSKPRRNVTGALQSNRRVTISARVSQSAVAVKAASGTSSARFRSPMRR